MGEPALAQEEEPVLSSCCETYVTTTEPADWKTCRVCGVVVCPSCDIRYKKPDKPACARHAEES